MPNSSDVAGRNSSDNSWLRPIYAELSKCPAFHHLSPSHQFAELCKEVERERPQEAAWLRKLNPTDQDELLRYFTMMVDQAAPAEAAALWRVHKNGREQRCIALHLVKGVDLRLMKGDDFRRTPLCNNASEARTLSEKSARLSAKSAGKGDKSTRTTGYDFVDNKRLHFWGMF